MKNKIDYAEIEQLRLAVGPQPGETYRHYKGGDYVVVARSVKEDTLEQLVTYRSLAKNFVWTRTLENWLEAVDGVRRFERVA